MSTPELTDIARRDTADGIAQQVVGAVIEADGKILLLQRPVDDFRGGTWELPSGKTEPDDADLLAALRREVLEETGLGIAEITNYLGAFDYLSGSGKTTRQHTWAVTATASNQVRLSEHDDFAWVAATDQHAVSDEVQTLIDAHFAAVGNDRPR